MRAAVVERYGPPEVVQVQDLPEPRAGKGQVVVRVRATTVNSGDARIRGCRFPAGFAVPGRLALGWNGPRRRVLGVVYSGAVESVGPGVEGVAVGDEVVGMTGAGMGAHAELAAVRADRLVPKPASVSHADAAAVIFGGTTARHVLQDVAAPGSRVLVNGASGAVGCAAVQVAHLAGARVTAVCSERNADLVRSLGAAEVVDHGRTSVHDLPAAYDVVLDAVGNLDRRSGRRLLAPDGVLVLACSTPCGPAAPCARVRGRRTRPTSPGSSTASRRGSCSRWSRRPWRSLTSPRRTASSTPVARSATSSSRCDPHARRAAAAVPGVGNQRAMTTDWPSVHAELQTQ